MRNRLKRKYNGYRDIRKQFKTDIYNLAKDNKAIVMLILETYSAYKHRRHIHKIWSMMINYEDFRKEYTEKLMGKMLTGRDEIYNSLGYIEHELYKKYKYKLPERFAMGDSLAVVYRIVREQKRNGGLKI